MTKWRTGMVSESHVDATDLKILETLTKDARTNLNEIAGNCGLSSSAILKRIENLKATGIILGTDLWVKHDVLGYPYRASIGIRVETPKIEQAVKVIRQQPNVIVCTKTVGKFDLMCLVVAKSTSEMDVITQKIKSTLGVKELSINLYIEDSNFKLKRVDKQPARDEKPDELDLKIIRELVKDCCMPFTKIASKVGVSHETVRKRYEKMKGNGTIARCSIAVDRSKLGYEGSAFFYITQAQGKNKSETINELKKISNFELVGNVMGDFDILVLTYVRNLRDLTRLVDQIQKVSGVDHVDISFATFTYFSYTPLPFSPIKVDTLELT
jgi:DNA-binding Lrp family transcriptional regulator